MTARGEQVGGGRDVAGFSWIASRSLAMTGRGASLRACEAIQLVVQEEAGLPRRFAPRNDGEG